ncbi:MAG TPA: NIPSNAP family protein [Longimicrobiaceae bacterium]|jgi:hypothetical protein|nr:NIPSNAP family protein [Longimicrobiaceae bacterium]
MIVVRNTFHIRPGQMKQALELARAGRPIVERLNFGVPRFLTDVTGEFYTLVLETQFDSLGDFEMRISRNFEDPEWQAWYRQFTAVMRGGRREIFRVVE